MKKLLSALCALMASMSLVSCYSDSYLGFDDMEPETLIYASSIVSCGNNTVIEYSDGQKLYIDVDPVSSLAEIIELNDTCCISSPEKVDWTNVRCSAKLLNREVKYACDKYVVYLCTYQLDIYKSGVIVPIKFTRERVHAVNKQGEEFSSYCSFQFGITGRYVGTEPMVTNEESHSRSYYDVSVDVYDRDELIGNMQVRISFYTPNAAISFNATVSDYEEA